MNDKVALVLGGGADGPPRPGEDLAMGNGRAIALRLAAEGAELAVTDIDLESAQRTIDAAGNGLALRSDVAVADECRATVAEVEAHFGRIDIIVSSVAVTDLLPLKAANVEDWQRLVDVNVTGHWITAQSALPGMLERGDGRFVFVSSTAAIVSSGASMAYEATKAAQLAIMRHIAVRYGGRGIRSNAVVLGVIDSTMVRRLFGDDGVADAARNRFGPMRRQGKPEEVAAAAAFLASDDASFVNGHALVVDGGVSAQWPNPG